MDSLKNRQESGFTTELAKPEDVLKLQEIIRTCWLATYPNEALGITAEDIAARDWFSERILERRRKEMIEDPNERTWVVKNDKKEIVGFCRVHKATGQEYTKKVDPYAEIDKIFILPEYQGKGLGEKLMQEGLGWSGNLEVRLEVVEYNSKAIKFYKEKFNFEETESIFTPPDKKLPSGTKIPTIEMIRRAQA